MAWPHVVNWWDDEIVEMNKPNNFSFGRPSPTTNDGPYLDTHMCNTYLDP